MTSSCSPLPIVILTVNRKTNYISTTLHSLRETGYFDSDPPVPLRIVVGNPDSSHLKFISILESKIAIHRMDEEEAAKHGLSELSVQQKCAFGHSRWMKQVAQEDNPQGMVLACEDDVVFARGWQKYLSGVLQDVWNKLGHNAIVSLYRLHQEGITREYAKERFVRGERWYTLHEHFWGCQAVVYPVAILNEIAEYLLANNVREYKQPIDILVGEYAWSHHIPVVATTPSLVEHIGTATTGQSHYFHRAGFFMESVESYI